MGIDPSISSTAVCLHSIKPKARSDTKYYLIGHGFTRKLTTHCIEHLPNRISIQEYERLKNPKGADLTTKEYIKTCHVNRLLDLFEHLLETDWLPNHQINHAVMESIAYSANGSIDQLAGLNYGIRRILHQHDIPVYLFNPNTIKKQFTGSGNAPKAQMVETWLEFELEIKAHMESYPDVNLPDDLADAFAIASMDVSSYQQ